MWKNDEIFNNNNKKIDIFNKAYTYQIYNKIDTTYCKHFFH
jgi:hypothetical protein